MQAELYVLVPCAAAIPPCVHIHRAPRRNHVWQSCMDPCQHILPCILVHTGMLYDGVWQRIGHTRLIRQLRMAPRHLQAPLLSCIHIIKHMCMGKWFDKLPGADRSV